MSSQWLAESLRVRTTFPQGGGYAYLWWIDAAPFRARNEKFPALDRVTDIAATGLGEQMLLVTPSLNVVFVHLTYRDGPDVAESASYRLAEMLLHARRTEPKRDAALVPVSAQRFPNEKALPDRVAVPLGGHAADYVGEYEVTPAVRATISFIDDGLFIDLTGRPQAELFQQSPDVFFLKVADVVLTFERDQSGQVQSVRVLDRGRAVAARKIR